MGKYRRIPGPSSGVTCYEHPTRRHNRKPDKYYLIRIRDESGKQSEEPLGWASRGWTDDKATSIAIAIREGIRTGKGPKSLSELRKQIEAKDEASAAVRAEAKRDGVLFADVVALYLVWAMNNKASWQADETRLRLHILPVLGRKALPEVTPTDIEIIKEKFLGSMSPASARQCLTLIHRVYSFSRTRHAPDGHGPYFNGDIPTAPVKLPQLNNERERFLSQTESKELIECAQKMDADMADIITLALHTGLRRNEIQGLLWENVNLETGTLTIPGQDGKRGKGKGKVFLNAAAIEVLRLRQTACARVFPGAKGGVIDISKQFRKIADAAGLNSGISDPRNKITFHSLRHTFASWLAMKGTPLLTIKELMRHRSVEMTMRYAHLIPDAKRQAVESLCES